jgi:hypothetical protein
VNEIRIAATESRPTVFTAANFTERHRGEQWVRVVGRVAVEHRHVQPSPYKVHAGKHLAYVTAPIVADDWKPQQSVAVLATFGPMSPLSVESWSQKFKVAAQPVQGQLRPGAVRDPAQMFPQLRINPSYVVINEGTKPKHLVAMASFLALMTVSGGLFVSRLRSLVKHEEPFEQL